MKNPEILDDVTLYDVMYEAGTQLGGAMAKLQEMAMDRGDDDEADKWLKEQQRLQRERLAIDPHDRKAMIAAYDEWNEREARLYKQIENKQATYAAD